MFLLQDTSGQGVRVITIQDRYCFLKNDRATVQLGVY